MAKGVSLGIFSETRDFERGIRTGVIDPLDDAQAAVEQFGDVAPPKIGDAIATDVSGGVRDAKGDLQQLGQAIDDVDKTKPHAGDDLATDVDAGVKSARTDLERLEDKMREYRKVAHTETGKAGHDIKTSVKDGAHEASEGVGEMKATVEGGAKEIAGSFDGTMEGVAGGVQGVLAEVGAGFGPLGVVVSTGLGLALGGILAQLAQTQEASDATKEKAGEMAGEFIDAGKKGKRSFDQVKDAITDMATKVSDDAGPNLIDLWKDASDAGADYKDLVLAIASGSPSEIAKQQRAVDKLTTAHEQSGIKAAGYASIEQVAAEKSGGAVDRLKGKLTKAGEAAKIAGQAQELAAKAGLSDFQSKADLIAQLHDAFGDAAGSVDDYIDKESGLFNVGKYITAMHKRAQALEEYQTTLSESKLTPEARSFIEAQGAEQAAALMAGYKRATPAQRAELEGIWTTSGRKAASSYGEALGDDLRDKTIKGPKISRPFVPAPDLTAVHRALNTLDNKTITLNLRGVAEGRRIF